MQYIFYNAKLNEFANDGQNHDAFLVNDGSIVFVGEKQEVFEMKTDETKMVDLKGKQIVPSFYDLDASVYKTIERNLKNAKKERKLENNADFDENYDRFDNYTAYKTEFLKLQKEYLKRGITTIQELYIGSKEFTFWKKLSEEKLLELDIIAYVDIKNSKQVMDDNCRSYRKYKNHFRLGGYSLAIDGNLSEKKAWLNKPYKKEGRYAGYSEYYDEHLTCLIKSALEEKKQLVVETNGDKAVDMFLRCFEEVVKKEKVEDMLRPIALKCNILSERQMKKMNELKVMPSFQVSDLIEKRKELMSAIGKSRLKKIQPFVLAKKHNMPFLIQTERFKMLTAFETAEMIASESANLSKVQKITKSEAFDSMIKTSAYALFDQEFKGSIENGKQATFIVVDDDNNILSTYIMGEKVYSSNKK